MMENTTQDLNNVNKQPVKWIVEKYIFADNRIPTGAFEELGIELFEFEYIPFLTKNIVPPFGENEPVVVYSTINAVSHFRNYFGCYYDDMRYNCNVYMSLLGVDPSSFLNSDHLYCTWIDLVKDPFYYYDLMGKNSLFFRPNKGIKEFTGNVWSKTEVVREIDMIAKLYNLNPETMILISTPKKILEEARFVIGDKQILASSRYSVQGKIRQDLLVNPDSTQFAQSVLESASWVPDVLFVMDIAQTPDGPKIIELNSFSCSGWYAIEPKELIRKVSDVVMREFEENQRLL